MKMIMLFAAARKRKEAKHMPLLNKTQLESSKVELEISIPAEDFQKAIEKAYRKRVKRINVPGFRKGKAPRKIIEKMYGEGFFYEDAITDLYPLHYSKALVEAEVEPVENADVEIVSMDRENGVVFKAVVTVKPTLDIDGYKGIEVEVDEYETGDKDVADELERLQDRNARLVDANDRPAKNGDQVLIDYEGFIDGVPFEGGKAEDTLLDLGSFTFIMGFEKQIEKHTVGEEFDVYVTFPPNYQKEELQGKPAIFKVKLKGIKGKIYPELDDEFAKDVSEFDTIEELKNSIREKKEAEFNQSRQRQIDSQISKALCEKINKDDIPEVMYKNMVDEMNSNLVRDLQTQGMSLESVAEAIGTDVEELKQRMAGDAENRVKLRMALESIARIENLTITEEDKNAGLKRYADMYGGIDIEDVRMFVNEDQLAEDVLVEKALQFVRDNTVRIPKGSIKKEEASEQPAAQEQPAADVESAEAEQPAAEDKAEASEE